MPYKPRNPDFFKKGVGFIWKDCNKCGGKSAYSSNGKCPVCKSRYNKEYRELSLTVESKIDPSEVFRESEPCKRCGDTRRYIKSSACPTCKKALQRAYRARKTQNNTTTHNKPENPPEARKTGLKSIFERWFCLPLNFYRSCVN